MSAAPIDIGAADLIDEPAKRAGLLRRVIRTRRMALVGTIIVITFVILGAIGPIIAPYPTDRQSGPLESPPSAEHLVGTNDAGYDMFSLLLSGIRTSLVVGLVGGMVSILIGGTAGIVAGYFGGLTDRIIVPLTDLFLVIPEVVLGLVLGQVIGQGTLSIIIVIALVLWAGNARVIRSQTKSIRERVYVKRARAIGASNTRVLLRHVLPQTTPLLIANAIIAIAVAVFLETALSFLGVGDPNTISLGSLIDEAFEASAAARGTWWMLIPPGVLVTLLILGCTLVGQALEDELNPRLKVSYLSIRSFRLRRDPKGGEVE